MSSVSSDQSTQPKYAALFPGQGSQGVGMGKDLYENFSYVREIFEEASDSLHLDVKKLCFEGPESELTLTENTQPCLLTVSIAAFTAAEKEMDFKPQVVAGHSLGEYSALVAAKSIPFAQAVRWVRERGLAMQKSVPVGEGTMAAILGLEDSKIDALCKAATAQAQKKRSGAESPQDAQIEWGVECVVEPANFNAPGQIVIAGSTDAVQEAIHIIKGTAGQFPEFTGGKAILLTVSAPFHCRLMKDARQRMTEIFTGLNASQKPGSLACPIVPNRTARLTQESGVILELLMEQIDHPVLWKQSMETLLGNGFSGFVEFGPGKVLTGLMKRIGTDPSQKKLSVAVGDATSVKTFMAQIS